VKTLKAEIWKAEMGFTVGRVTPCAPPIPAISNQSRCNDLQWAASVAVASGRPEEALL